MKTKGFIYKHIAHPLLSKAISRKAYTNNPYIGFIIDAADDDVIADEQFRVGMAYQDGLYMLPQDNDKALLYYKKAAERGHAVAQLYLAMRLMRYNDDHNDDVMFWLQKAAEQGEHQAMFNLGISYHRGDFDGKVNIEKSTYLFRKSAEKGNGPACARLASMYYNGDDGLAKDVRIAKFWALEAYGFGDDQDGQVLDTIYRDKDYIDGLINTTKIYNEAAEASEAHALYKIGNAYIEKDISKAVEYWQKASDLGSNYAKCNLARYYSQEKKDYPTANKLFEKAAMNGIEEAQLSLAKAYYYGSGVSKDIRKSWEYLEKAINKGNTEARYFLATICLNNSLQDILPDKVMRGMSYMDMTAKDQYPPALEFYERNKSI